MPNPGLFKRLFHRVEIHREIEADLKLLEESPAEEVFKNDGPPMAGTSDTEEDFSVTGSYALVSKQIEGAINEKRKATEAAQRITTSVGARPLAKVK